MLPWQASDIAKLGGTPVLGLYGTRDAQFPVASLDKFKVGVREGAGRGEGGGAYGLARAEDRGGGEWQGCTVT